MGDSIRGVLPVAHTPFTEDDEIDWASLERQIEWAFQQGADGFCTGMVSELSRLTHAERTELTRRLAQMNNQRGAFVASVGAESTKQAVEFARDAEQLGCAGVMAIPPMSLALPEDELVEYFSEIAAAVNVPMIVQDASGYMGRAIPESVYQELLARFGSERMMFKPEAPPVGAIITWLREHTDGAACVFDGSGGNLLIDSYRRGIAGTIPGMDFLEGVIAVWQALERGDEATAYRIYFPLCALVSLQLQGGLDGLLAIEKYVLCTRGLFTTSICRRPNAWQFDAETRREVDRLLKHLDAAIRA